MLQLIIVSSVFPDFDTITFSVLFLLIKFLRKLIKLSKNIIFFFILFIKKKYIALLPNTDPPRPIKLIVGNFFTH